MSAAVRLQEAFPMSAPRVGALRGLLEEALAAADSLTAVYARHTSSEWEIDIAESRAFDTRRALKDYLLFEHGVGSTLAGRLGEVL